MWNGRSGRFEVVCLLVGLLSMWQVAAAARVYHWVDAQGQSHYSDSALEPEADARVLEVSGPPLQRPSQESVRRLEENKRWFQQRTRERQSAELKRAKQRAIAAKAARALQQRCDKARYKLEDAVQQYDAQRRTWLKPKAKRQLKEKLELYRLAVKRQCDF
ncbi:DUF4124 domain-containing protein [Aestuariicella hydrocarbonica]|uniref:DUF4124 domain-containing protein n=1 Tax=Pseudomaricurvus hydrocarbonicus TaxID=1470433 RepID=A0A9E5T3G4_9GAMM|nr:DUF4124 domain-containing protein [Aestuariicella hydrocarbonica]NHO67127.1 DUF4124 domain-containing protein [Aestuariicella hydrocarbonica]